MEGMLPLLVVVAVFFANLPALKEQWLNDRPGFIKTVWMLTFYMLLCVGAAALLIWLVARNGPQAGEEWRAIPLTVAVIGLVFYGALILLRVVPRYKAPPRWLMHFGLADYILLGPIAASLAVLFLP